MTSKQNAVTLCRFKAVEVLALHEFITVNGRNWKRALQKAWEADTCGAILRGLRDREGLPMLCGQALSASAVAAVAHDIEGGHAHNGNGDV
jgi:hypothetical protein